jgi:hypothetical protein
MLQSVCWTFRSNSMQRIRPATQPLFVLRLCLTALTIGWGYWGLLDYILHVLRVPSLEAPRVGGSLDQRQGNSVNIVTVYGLEGRGIKIPLGRESSHASRPALGHTQPPVNGYLVFPVGWKLVGAWC